MSAVCPSCGQGWKHDASVCGHPFHCLDRGDLPRDTAALVETVRGALLAAASVVYSFEDGHEHRAIPDAADAAAALDALAQRLGDAEERVETLMVDCATSHVDEDVYADTEARAERAEEALRGLYDFVTVGPGTYYEGHPYVVAAEVLAATAHRGA